MIELHEPGPGVPVPPPGTSATPLSSHPALPERNTVVKTKAAVLFDLHKPFEIIELDLDDPGPGEVLIKYTAAGLCH